jgi:hypothetical protein
MKPFRPGTLAGFRTFVIPVVHDSDEFRTPAKLGTIILASERTGCEAGRVVPITQLRLFLRGLRCVCVHGQEARVKDESCLATRANECGRLCMEREDHERR